VTFCIEIFGFSEAKNRIINDIVKNVFVLQVNRLINVFYGGQLHNC